MSRVTDALERAATERAQLSNGGAIPTPQPPRPLPVTPNQPQELEEVISRCQLKLAEAERRAAEQRRHEAGLQAQVAIYQDLSTQAHAQLDALKRQQVETAQQSEVSERARATYERQLTALRECQALSQTARLVQEELESCGRKIAESTEAQQRFADESARWASRREELRRRLEQLRQQVGEAMARFETAVELPPA